MIIKEENWEEEFVKNLKNIGWKEAPNIHRKNNKEVIDYQKLKEQLIKINSISDDQANQAIVLIIKRNAQSWDDLNILGWKLFIEGVKVQDKKTKVSKTLHLISENTSLNNYQVVRQLKIENSKGESRIPDIVMYINGLPIIVVELKNPLANERLNNAFNQNESLKNFSPELWKFNIMNVISNRNYTKYGSTTSNFSYMAQIKGLKTRDNKDMFEFLFGFHSIYDFIQLFSFYSNEQGKNVKYMAQPHQIEAVKLTIKKLKNNNHGDSTTKGGVIWHTQGSGKSVTMVLLAKAIMLNYPKSTIVMVTDRKELDSQLYQRFLNAQEYLRANIMETSSRDDLILKLKNRKGFGIVFSTVQKFNENSTSLSNRDDIFVMVDEAHRSQNEIEEKIVLDSENKEAKTKYGFAGYMRKSLPNAHFIAFTGTPLMGIEKDTTKIFGNYNHKYLMNDSIEDGTTVPINYELRKVSFDYNKEYLDEMDNIQQNYINSLNKDDIYTNQKIEELLNSIKIKDVLENPNLIEAKSIDIMKHYDKQKTVLHGKAMIVAWSRKAAFMYYKNLKKLNPQWNNDEIILVMFSTNQDPKEMVDATVPAYKEEEVATEFKKPNSKHKIAIVVDKWLTGFDVPDLDVMYLDKIIKWHNLMQAIARVNRTYYDEVSKNNKESGLIVDYIGIWNKLSEALLQYTKSNNEIDNFSIQNIEEAKNKIIKEIKEIDENFLPNLINVTNNKQLNEKDQYYQIMNWFDNILAKTKEDKGNFVNKARRVKKLKKIAFSILSDVEIKQAKIIEIINSLCSLEATKDDEGLIKAISDLKKASLKALNVDSSTIEVGGKILSKQLNQVVELMKQESKNLEKNNPRVTVKILEATLREGISNLQKSSPSKAKKASERLQEIIQNLEDTGDFNQAIKLIYDVANYVNENEEELKGESPEMRAFYDIVSNDEWLKNNNPPEILQQIAKKLLDKVKKYDGIKQYTISSKIKTKVKHELEMILKNDYNYPPDEGGKKISKILIDEIDNQIKINPEYFEN